MAIDEKNNTSEKEYLSRVEKVREKLSLVSPSFCLAKWKMLSLHLTNGRTHSCYHPPAHQIDETELQKTPAALHNTSQKILERQQMRNGQKPEGCSYCWKIEDAKAEALSDRAYRSSDIWDESEFEKIQQSNLSFDESVKPSSVEVNFNQACNFKCLYCSPHLSSEWEKEVEKFGFFKLENYNHNDVQALRDKNLMPLGLPNSDNNYVKAFWRWWPELYPELKVFRMTGGEPLLDANTWKVFNYILQQPNPNLELSITSNLCPPKEEIFEKFIDYLQKIESQNSIKEFLLYVSCDSVGAQAEYIRTGMNFILLQKNIRSVLRETQQSSVTLINTFNLLSIPKLKDFLKWVLELRQEFGLKSGRQRIWFDIPVLTQPEWLNIRLLAGTTWEKEVEECIAFMKQNLQQEDYATSFKGFKKYEVLKLERNLAIMKQAFSSEKKKLNHFRFVQYMDEIDLRRETNFLATFQELKEFYLKPD